MATAEYLICPDCGARNAEGPLCSRCGSSIMVAAEQLPRLLIRRLLWAGFAAVPAVGSTHDLASLIGAFQGAGKPDCQEVLAFPDLRSPPQSIYRLYMAAIACATDGATRGLQSLAHNLLSRASRALDHIEAPHILGLHVLAYIVYTGGLSPEAVRAHRLPLRARSTRVRRKWFPFRTRLVVTLIPIDAKTGKAHFTTRYREPDRQVTGGLRQLRRQQAPPRPLLKNYARLIVKKPVESFLSYIESLSLAGEPDVLAYRITSGRLRAKELFATVAASAVVAGLGAQVLGVDIGALDLGIGFLSKIVDGLILMSAYLASAGLLHLPLHVAGGRAPFRSTFLATTFLSAVTYPVLVGWVGVLRILGATPGDQNQAFVSGQWATIGLAVFVMSAAHGLSWKRTSLVLLVVLPIALTLIALVLGLIAIRIIGFFASAQ